MLCIIVSYGEKFVKTTGGCREKVFTRVPKNSLTDSLRYATMINVRRVFDKKRYKEKKGYPYGNAVYETQDSPEKV